MPKSKGHAEHTQAASQPSGLAGQFHRPIKITMLGAGSGFTPRLMNDVLLIPGADRGEIALVDIDRERLTTMHRLINRLVKQLGRTGWKVSASRRRRDVLRGTDYIVNCIEVCGLECVRHDNDIPARYGIDQCIGDTIGPGGLFKALRTIPVWLDMLRDAEELCPEAIVLNYTNPMNMLCLAASRVCRLPVVGLCHSVQGTSRLLASARASPTRRWRGNRGHQPPRLVHQAGAQRQGPVPASAARPADLAGEPADPKDPRSGSQGHDAPLRRVHHRIERPSERIPPLLPEAAGAEGYCGDGYDGGSRFYADNWPKWRKGRRRTPCLVAGKTPLGSPRSWEYASWIIEAREKDRPSDPRQRDERPARGR